MARPEDPEALRSAGYYLTRRVARPAYSAEELLPEQLLSASECLCPFAPDLWAIRWTGVQDEERRETAARFGLSHDRREALIDWATAALETDDLAWANAFPALDTARDFAARFLDLDGLVLLGLALPEDLAQRFLEAARPAEGEGAHGPHVCLERDEPPAPGGRVLGWEPLGWEHGFHSWLCNGLEREIDAKLGLRPNAHGFLEPLEAARRAAAHIARDDVGAEPGIWLPWRLTEYPLGA